LILGQMAASDRQVAASLEQTGDRALYRKMPRCYVALGGNVGDVEKTLQDAVARLAGGPGIRLDRVSPVFETRPVGAHSGGTFRNAAAEIETSLDPLSVLDFLQELERRAGRTPGSRWAPRPLDLDLIFYAERVMTHPQLTVPHPACWYRRFVLDPLAAIAPDVRHPVKQATVAELRARLLSRPLVLAFAGSTPNRRRELAESLTGRFAAQLEITQWQPDEPGSPEPAILAWLGADASGSTAIEFQTLPLLPRLDVSSITNVEEYLNDVVQAALG
jgi:2-amino-4-hydroxy-6-hydroxymethyldihydropteridine diphosphokinase